MDRSGRRARLTALALAAAWAGCGDPDRVPATAGLGAQFHVESWDGVTSQARAVLRDPRHGRVALPATDEVQINLPGWQIELVPRTDGGPWYASSVPAVPAGEWHNFAVIRLDRPNAGYNQVTMPTDPAPTGPASWSRSGEALTVGWVAVDRPEPLRIRVTGPCLDPVVAHVVDATGRHDFAPGAIVGQGSCDATVTVSRWARAPVDDALRGGSVEAWQHRQLVVASAP